MTRRILLIMTRQPQVGAVKTRLARHIGAVAAWRFQLGTLRSTCRNTRGPFWRSILLVTPDGARYRWPGGLSCIDQGHGDLGRRMRAGLTAFGRGVSVILIGSDIPAVTTPILRAAFQRLAASDVVFGPARDGGFWLIGLSGRRPLWRAFAGVTWSTPETLTQTLQNFRGRRVAFAATLSDVDDVSGWLSAKGVL
jgi:rSAM/selenodomain-associated transferase 1